jgi:hypothetical protein
LIIPLTNSTPPPALEAVGLVVSIAGRQFVQCFASAANLTTTFSWDGLDAYGRPLVGGQKVFVKTSYFYPTLSGYSSAGSGGGGGGGGGGGAVPISFGEFSAIPGSGIGKDRQYAADSLCAYLVLSVSKNWTGILNGGDARGNSIAGWSLSSHHFYDATGQVLLLGDGTRRSTNLPEMQNRIVQMPGGPCQPGGDPGVGDGGPVSKALVCSQFVAYAPDGTYYVGNPYRIRKVTPDGIITTVIGNGQPTSLPPSQTGDNGPAINAVLTKAKGMVVGPTGDLYILDDQRIRRISSDGIVRAFAGTGQQGYAGDGGPAQLAEFWNPGGVVGGAPGSGAIAVSSDGTVYVADTYNQRIRKIGTDGIIQTVAGTGANPTAVLNNVAAIGQAITQPLAVAISPSGDVVFSESGASPSVIIPPRIRKITPEGIITTLAGQLGGDMGGAGYSGDDGPADQAQISNNVGTIAVAPDGAIYFGDYDYGAAVFAIREIDLNGTMLRLVGSASLTPNYGYNRPALQTSLIGPDSLSFAPDGTLHFIDGGGATYEVHLQLGARSRDYKSVKPWSRPKTVPRCTFLIRMAIMPKRWMRGQALRFSPLATIPRAA